MTMFDSYYGNLQQYEKFYCEMQQIVQKEMDQWAKKETNHSPTEKELISRIRSLPDLYFLALQLIKDEEIPFRGKGTLYIGLIYAAAPIDLISDHIAVYGWMDDLVVVAMALDYYFSLNWSQAQEAVRGYWRQSKDLRALLFAIISAFDEISGSVFPASMNRLIRDMFS